MVRHAVRVVRIVARAVGRLLLDIVGILLRIGSVCRRGVFVIDAVVPVEEAVAAAVVFVVHSVEGTLPVATVVIAMLVVVMLMLGVLVVDYL